MHHKRTAKASPWWPGITYFVALLFFSVDTHANALNLEVGIQQRHLLGMEIDRVAIGNPEVADVSVIDSQEILITPLTPGSTNLTVWPEKGRQVVELILNVKAESGSKKQALKRINSPDFSVNTIGEHANLQGEISSLEQHDVVRKLLNIDDTNGIDSSQRRQSSQVQIDIKIVEVNRNKLLDYSGSFSFLKPNSGRLRGITSPEFNTDDLFDFSFLRVKSNGEQISSVLSILEGNGFAYTLAEPSLTAMSGQSANFLAGGEFPVPVRGTGADNSVTVEYKEFGVRLSLTPTVLGKDRIALKVAPEVSELDFNAGIESGGVTVPALRVRRTDTTVALGSGESFILSGLISKNTLANVDKLPGLGDIPILGAFFRSNRFDRNETELLMIVTPHLVQPISRHADLPALPGEQYRHYDPDFLEFIFTENGGFDSDSVSSGFSK